MAWRRERSGLARIMREEFMEKVIWELELERQVNISERREKGFEASEADLLKAMLTSFTYW